MQGYIRHSLLIATIGSVVLAAYFWDKHGRNQNDARQYVVQAAQLEIVEQAIDQVGGEITWRLGIINGVEATLTRDQVTILEMRTDLRISANEPLAVAGPVLDTHFPTLIGASSLHESGIDGRGITIAVIDTGLWKKSATQYTADQEERILAQYDVIRDRSGHEMEEEADED